MKNNCIILIFFCFFFLSNTCVIAGEDEQVPVIFIHQGDSYYLKDSLWQAKQFNERVILVGDESNKKYAKNLVEYYDIGDYWDEAEAFSHIYIHLSPYETQLSRFQRWFILSTFMQKNDIRRCMHCDSDVMLYCNASEEFKSFKQYDFSLMPGICGTKKLYSGATTFWCQEPLKDFCTFLTDFYQKKENLANWMIDFFNSKGFWVGDMRLLTEYVAYIEKIKKYTLGNVCAIIDGAIFDRSIVRISKKSNDFELIMLEKKVKKIKKIKWIDGLPYNYYKDLDKFIRMKSLHFAGPTAKKLMSIYRTDNQRKS